MQDQNHSQQGGPTVPARRAAILRGLRKGGMVAAPVLMSTVGRSSMAAVIGAKSPSGFASINSSQETSLQSSGISPEAWASKVLSTGLQKTASGWPAGNTPTQLFSAVFGSVNGMPSQTTLLDALKGAGPATNASPTNLNVAGYVAAAFLNARAGLTPVLKSSDALEMWNGFLAGGYRPAAGVSWNGAQIVRYISTQTIG